MRLSTHHFPSPGSAAALADVGAVEPKDSPFTLFPQPNIAREGVNNEKSYQGS